MVWASREDEAFPERVIGGRSSGCRERLELGKHPHTQHVWGPVVCDRTTDPRSQAALETLLRSLFFFLSSVRETLVSLQQVNSMVTFVLLFFF